MANRSETMFSAREMRYLQSLPAVERVSQKRIQYTEEFKRDCMRRYNAGESPVRIFREAGLDPSLIGYKRVERCFARWKKLDGTDSQTDDGRGLCVPMRERWIESGARPVNYDTHRKETVEPVGNAEDFELVILQQARRIRELENKIRDLESSLGAETDSEDGPHR